MTGLFFKQVEQEMQESLGPLSAGAEVATPVFLLLLLFSMPKNHLLYLLFSMPKNHLLYLLFSMPKNHLLYLLFSMLKSC